MHRALLIEDIQLYIFNQVEEQLRDSSALSALARTCQAFTQVALDVLWRNLDCFTRLIQCMPSDLWSPQAVTEEQNVSFKWEDVNLTLCRPISSSDWTIFYKYSRRVRSVELSYKMDGTPVTIDDSLMLALCTAPAPTPLLPNLTSLEWLIKSYAYLVALRRLVSSPLMSLTLAFPRVPHPSLHPESTLQIPFQRICPSLRNLTVERGEENYSPKLLEKLKRSIGQLKRLDTIRLGSLENETIVSLARLSTLTDATFEIPSDFSAYLQTLPLNPSMLKPAFSKVRNLQITHRNLASVAALLNNFTFDLHQISVFSENLSPSTRATIGDFFAALASTPSRLIREIDIDDTDLIFGPYEELQPFSISELRPLLQFNNLGFLHLNFHCPLTVNDAILLEMSHAWPSIYVLRLNHSGHYSPDSHVTPPAFMSLLDRCPKLRQLALPVNFSTVDSEDFDPLTIDGLCDQRRMHNRAKLLALSLGSYHITHPHAVAKFLASLFPGGTPMSMLVKGDAPERTYRNNWDLTLRYYCGEVVNEKGEQRERYGY